MLDEVYNEKRCPKAFGIRSCLFNKNNSFMVLLLADMLQLSLYLQGSAVNFSHLDVRVKIAVNELHALIENCKTMRRFLNYILEKWTEFCKKLMTELCLPED